MNAQPPQPPRLPVSNVDARDRARVRTKNRNTELGDQASFCVSCGWARRFFPGVVEPEPECPHCGAAVIHACPACEAPVLSTMSIDCDECGANLRDAYASGAVAIRRPPRAPR